MFRNALKIADEFTRPVVISRRTVGGVCRSGIGSFVIVNDDGWIITAGHILRQWHQLFTEVQKTQTAQAARQKILDDKNLDRKERTKRLAKAPAVAKEDNDRCSAWWSYDGVELKDFSYISLSAPDFEELVDIGVGRLDPFDPKSVKTYPVFKDPSKDFEQGVSLCKVGFPFHEITPVWDDTRGMFALPPGALPLPRFPIEGIFSRIAEVVIQGAPPLGFPCLYVETSTPGLRGQSGGPIVDVQGTIWAIQAKTISLDLGFKGPKQFLNVGLGVHPSTILGFLKERGVKCQVSPY